MSKRRSRTPPKNGSYSTPAPPATGGNVKIDTIFSSSATGSCQSGIIVGKDITPISDIPYPLIFWVFVGIIMGVLYYLEIYNCGRWLFVCIGAAAYFSTPKWCTKVYQYNFEVSVGGHKYFVSAKSVFSTINPSDISATFRIVEDVNPNKTCIIYTYENIEIILKHKEAFSPKCFIPVGEKCLDLVRKIGYTTTIYKIKGDIIIASTCGNFRAVIQKETVPEMSWYIDSLR